MTNEEIADDLWRQYTILVSDRKCMFCKSEEKLWFCWAIPGDKYRSVRYDPRNALMLCKKCYVSFDTHPENYLTNLIDVFTEEMLEELMQDADKLVTKINYKKVINKLRKEIDVYRNRAIS